MLTAELREYVPKKLAKALDDTKQFAFDLETRAAPGRPEKDALDERTCIPFLLVVASGKESKAFSFDDPKTTQLIHHLLTDSEMEAIVHNALYDIVVLHSQKIVNAFDIKARLRDTMLCQFILDEEQSKGLKSMALAHLKHKMRTYEETTFGNPLWKAREELKQRIFKLNHAAAHFSKERPFPTFDSEQMINRKDYAEEVRKSYTAPSSTGDLFSEPEFQTATVVPIAVVTHQVNQFFGEEQRRLYQNHLEKNVLPGLRDEYAKLDKQLSDEMIVYAEDDGRQTLKLWNKLTKAIDKLGLLQWLYFECEVRRITVQMSVTGIPIKAEVLDELEAEINPLIEEFYNEIQNTVKGFNDDGAPFNPKSSDQVSRALFSMFRCAIPVYQKLPDGRELPKLTPAGEEYLRKMNRHVDLRRPETITDDLRGKYLACDGEVLERVDHPLGMLILNYRALEKVKSTYIDAVRERMQSLNTDRLIGNFNSVGTKTGRLSSNEPNLQNIPSRKKGDDYDDRVQGIGPRIRDAFACSPGKVMIVVDQSQIELRIIAHFCNEKSMVDIYKEGVEIDGTFYYTGDIHAKTSKQLTIPRKLAKNVNFGFNYGMGANKFARQIRLMNDRGEYDIGKAAQWRNGFFQTYPGIPNYIEFLTEQWNKGIRHFKMLCGRKRHFPDEPTAGGKILNAKVQGSSADLLKLSMVIIDRYVKPACPSVELLFQVHDELGFQCDPEEAELAGKLIKYVLEYPWYPISVPVLASAKICESWAAKDDDNIPEIGSYYAAIKGEGGRVFTKDNWSEFIALDSAKKVDAKSATAMLTPADMEECRRYIPSSIPTLC